MNAEDHYDLESVGRSLRTLSMSKAFFAFSVTALTWDL
jgi:hypothetical protein